MHQELAVPIDGSISCLVRGLAGPAAGLIVSKADEKFSNSSATTSIGLNRKWHRELDL